jgi:hypothetical protein
MDLVTINPGTATDNVLVLLGTGGGRFLRLPTQSVVPGVTAAAAGDWDGDGKQDLATLSGSMLCVLHSLTK